jgi:SSS family solute:Na+ symporter
MITGGTVTITLLILNKKLPLGLDPNIFGILASLIIYVVVYFRKEFQISFTEII